MKNLAFFDQKPGLNPLEKKYDFFYFEKLCLL